MKHLIMKLLQRKDKKVVVIEVVSGNNIVVDTNLPGDKLKDVATTLFQSVYNLK